MRQKIKSVEGAPGNWWVTLVCGHSVYANYHHAISLDGWANCYECLIPIQDDQRWMYE